MEIILAAALGICVIVGVAAAIMGAVDDAAHYAYMARASKAREQRRAARMAQSRRIMADLKNRL